MKLNSANDILNNASRYGDWVRRARRRKRLEVLQVGACVLGGAAGGGPVSVGVLQVGPHA